LKSPIGCLLVLVFPVAAGAQPTPPEELDNHWADVCAGAEPGSPFADRCAEILNAGPGSGDRRSSAAIGNNVGIAAAGGRLSDQDEEREVANFAGVSFFLTFDSGQIDRSASDFESGFETGTRGVLFGADRFFSEAVVVGVAGRYAEMDTDFDGGAGTLDSSELSLLLYQNVTLGESTYLDTHLGLGRLSYESTRAVRYSLVLDAGQPSEQTVNVSTVATAETEGSQLNAGAKLSRDLTLGSVTVSSMCGVDYVGSGIDGYEEEDPEGLALAYESQAIRSLTSNLGLGISRAFRRDWGVLSPEIVGEFVHEFEDDSRVLTTRFVQDTNGYPLLVRTQGPDRDYFHVGGSVSAIMPNGFVVFADYRGLMGHSWLDDHAVSAGIRMEI
jgi:outer membrane autotransporter protein